MSATPTQPSDSSQADSSQEHQPDTVATPEGDNEYGPDQPLSPSAPIPERPRGDQPHSEEPLYPAQD